MFLQCCTTYSSSLEWGGSGGVAFAMVRAVCKGVRMIHQLGNHLGKQVVFGFDRYLIPELDEYNSVLSQFGIPMPSVVSDNLHYLTSAERLCNRIQGRADHVGILVCATGMGMSIAANKFREIYAVRCLSVEDARLARIINNANVLCLAARVGLQANKQIIEEFMITPYEGRKLSQLEYITQMELEVSPPMPSQAMVAGYSRRRTA